MIDFFQYKCNNHTAKKKMYDRFNYYDLNIKDTLYGNFSPPGGKRKGVLFLSVQIYL